MGSQARDDKTTQIFVEANILALNLNLQDLGRGTSNDFGEILLKITVEQS